MTDQDLRDLLHDRVADIAGPDLSATAWQRAAGLRRRRRARVIGGVVAAVAVVAVVVASVDDRTGVDRDGAPPASSLPSRSGDPASDVPRATRMEDYRGAAVWEAPPPEDELALPRWREPSLPEVIDPDDAPVGVPGGPARGLVVEGRRVLALGEGGVLSELDLARLAPVSDEGGNRLSPVTAYSLAPDGRHAFFVQESSLEVLDLVTGRWRSVDTPDWLAEGARWTSADEIWVPHALSSRGSGTIHDLDGTVSEAMVSWIAVGFGREETWGPVAATGDRVAQAMFLAGPVDGTGVSNPEAVVVATDGRHDVLTMWPAGEETRQKGCCEVLGFLDDDTVLFASRSTAGSRLLAWRVGTSEVYLVSRLAGGGTLVAWRPAT
ncbi:hypothetical protein [Nocardioides sp.]|uniref:hypothetical protein n=1 Tax=Nocardioides sp. TaxID=35761 RepID=UPI002ED7E840